MKKQAVAVFVVVSLFFIISCNLINNDSFKGFVVNNQTQNNILPNWARKYSTSLTDHASSIFPFNDGYVINGFFELPNGGVDGFAIKLDLNGQIIWQKSYGGEGNDVLKFSVPTSDGGFIFIGDTYSFGFNNGGIIAIKVSSQGDFQWAKTYDSLHQDFVNAVLPVSDGILIAGSSGEKSFLSKISYQGQFIFGKVLLQNGNNSPETINCLINVNESGQDYYILGGSGYYHPNDFGIHDGLIVKVNASTNQIVWAKSIRKNSINEGFHSTDSINFIVPDGGEYVLLGQTGYQAYYLSFIRLVKMVMLFGLSILKIFLLILSTLYQYKMGF